MWITPGRLITVRSVTADYPRSLLMLGVDFFAKQTRRRGLLPTILDLISARKVARADLKKETDPFKKAVLVGRQLALKARGLAPPRSWGLTSLSDQHKIRVRFHRSDDWEAPVSRHLVSVAVYGRTMIERTRQEVEAYYTIDNGQEHNAEVVQILSWSCSDLKI